MPTELMAHTKRFVSQQGWSGPYRWQHIRNASLLGLRRQVISWVSTQTTISMIHHCRNAWSPLDMAGASSQPLPQHQQNQSVPCSTMLLLHDDSAHQDTLSTVSFKYTLHKICAFSLPTTSRSAPLRPLPLNHISSYMTAMSLLQTLTPLVTAARFPPQPAVHQPPPPLPAAPNAAGLHLHVRVPDSQRRQTQTC